MIRLRCLVLQITTVFSVGVWAAEPAVRVAVAANFAMPAKELTRVFLEQTGTPVTLSVGSSGKFATQIQQNAPFDILLSADQTIPAQLEQKGLGVEGSRFTYAEGGLVLWSAHSNIDVAEILRSNRFNKLALANPKLAPYGVAAVEALQYMGLENKTQPRWVQGENIAQAYQFVASGNAQLGFIARSQWLSHQEQGSGWPVPASMHSPIKQDALLLVRAEENRAAHKFLDFLKGSQAQVIIQRYGYDLSVDSVTDSSVGTPPHTASHSKSEQEH